MHGAVSDVGSNAERVPAPLREAGAGYTAECYDESGRLPSEYKSGAEGANPRLATVGTTGAAPPQEVQWSRPRALSSLRDTGCSNRRQPRGVPPGPRSVEASRVALVACPPVSSIEATGALVASHQGHAPLSLR
jgi:hypothetical protein